MSRVLTKTPKNKDKQTRINAAFAAHLKKHAGPRRGFDFPTKLAGQSNWTGSDGKPVMVYFDPSLANGASLAAAILAAIDDLMAYCDWAFGVQGQGGNIIIAALGGATDGSGGAYHYDCSFSSGGDWYIDAATDPQECVGLAMAEISESYMGLQSKGWNCGGSGGEALSRFLAEIASGGPGGALAPYSSAASWDGSDWISKDQGTDGDYPSIGCGVLYLWWMVSQGYTVDQITQAGEPDGTLSTNYQNLTGKSATQAFCDFKAAAAGLGSPSSFQNDNPWNAATPPYPQGGGGGGPGPTPGGDITVDVPQLSVMVAGQAVATIPAFTINGKMDAGEHALPPVLCSILTALTAAFCGSSAKKPAAPAAKKPCGCKQKA